MVLKITIYKISNCIYCIIIFLNRRFENDLPNVIASIIYVCLKCTFFFFFTTSTQIIFFKKGTYKTPLTPKCNLSEPFILFNYLFNSIKDNYLYCKLPQILKSHRNCRYDAPSNNGCILKRGLKAVRPSDVKPTVAGIMTPSPQLKHIYLEKL